MIKKLIIKEDNEQIKNRYIEFITNGLTQPVKIDASGIYFEDADYKKVNSVVSDIKNILSNADFELISVDYDAEYSLSTYKYIKNEFGFIITVTLMLDDSNWDLPICKVIIDITDEDNDSENKINEAYNSDWVKNANEDDLIQLRSELEEFDMNAERIYNAVKNSVDRNNESELNGLISAIKNINNELKEYAEAWEIN